MHKDFKESKNLLPISHNVNYNLSNRNNIDLVSSKIVKKYKIIFLIVFVLLFLIMILINNTIDNPPCNYYYRDRVDPLQFLRQSRNLSEYVKPNVDTSIVNVATPIMCQKNTTKISVVYFITSTASNHGNRQAIRDTWGLNIIPPPIFFVGVPSSKADLSLIKQEALLYKDIILENFDDNYNTLTIKTGFMLKHFQKYCPQAKYLMKTDDDMFINTNVIDHILETETEETLIGHLIINKPHRNIESKWNMPYWLYGREVYPEYLSGTAYLVPGSMVNLIYESALDTPMIHLEDVMYTGLVANEQLGLPIRDDKRFHDVRKFSTNYCIYRNSATVHKFTYNEIYQIWEGRHKNCCSFKNKIIFSIFGL